MTKPDLGDRGAGRRRGYTELPPPAGSEGVAAMVMGATTHAAAQLFRHVLVPYF